MTNESFSLLTGNRGSKFVEDGKDFSYRRRFRNVGGKRKGKTKSKTFKEIEKVGQQSYNKMVYKDLVREIFEKEDFPLFVQDGRFVFII